MRPDEFSKELKQQPFRPFRIHISNGNTYEVNHPELVMVFKSVIHIGKPSVEYNHPVLDDYEVVSLLHTNKIEYLDAVSSASGNGSGKKKKKKK